MELLLKVSAHEKHAADVKCVQLVVIPSNRSIILSNDLDLFTGHPNLDVRVKNTS